MKRRYLSVIMLLVLLFSFGQNHWWSSISYHANASSNNYPPHSADWSSPVNISQSPAKSYRANILHGGNGTVDALWMEPRELAGRDDVYHASRDPSGTWQGPTRAFANFSLLDATSEDDGTIHVLLTTYDDSDRYYSNKNPGGHWATPANISNSSPVEYGGVIAVAQDGRVHIVWSRGTRHGYDIYHAMKPKDGAWSPPTNLSDDFDFSTRPEVAVDGIGGVHVAWVCGRGNPAGEVVYRTSLSGGPWSDPVILAETPYQYASPEMAVDSSNTLHMAWGAWDSGGSDWDIYYRSRASSGEWSLPVPVSTTSGHVWHPQLTVAVDQTVHLIWHDVTPGPAEIFAATKPPGKPWSEPIRVSYSIHSTLQSQLVAGPAGAVHAVWTDARRTYREGEIFYAAKYVGDGWSQQVNISQSGTHSDRSGIAVAPDGSIHVVWEEDLPGNEEIYYATKSRPRPFLRRPFVPNEQPPRCRRSKPLWKCLNAFFDHKFPNLKENDVFRPYWGERITGNISRDTCKPRDHCYDGHTGTDFGLKWGTQVLAAYRGTAKYKWSDCSGHTIIITHPNGYRTRYSHLRGKGLIVNESGKRVKVKTGQRIGRVGKSGSCTTGAHLHFGLRYDLDGDGRFRYPKEQVDPFGWMGSGSDPWVARKGGPPSYCLWVVGCSSPR